MCRVSQKGSLTLSVLQTNTDTIANSADPNVTARNDSIRIYTVCHSVIIFSPKPLLQQ